LFCQHLLLVAGLAISQPFIAHGVKVTSAIPRSASMKLLYLTAAMITLTTSQAPRPVLLLSSSQFDQPDVALPIN